MVERDFPAYRHLLSLPDCQVKVFKRGRMASFIHSSINEPFHISHCNLKFKRELQVDKTIHKGVSKRLRSLRKHDSRKYSIIELIKI